MKVRVVKPFKDKHTKVIYQKGQEIDITNERYEELTSAALGPFVREIDVPENANEGKAKQKKPTKKKSTKK